MENERKKVLEMLAQGKITAQDAERLLDRLGATASADADSAAPSTTGAPLKFMRVHVDSQEGDTVDIRLPLGLLRSGIKVSAMMPREAAEAMKVNGLDFSEFSKLTGDDFMNAMRELSVDVNSHEGDKVRIFCE